MTTRQTSESESLDLLELGGKSGLAGGNIAKRIAETRVAKGKVALFYLGQAGFFLKSADGVTVLIDPYFSDAANRLFGFKRMNPPLRGWEELTPDYYLATHSHIDHLDTDSLPTFAKNAKTFFVGAIDCAEPLESAGIGKNQRVLLRTGESWSDKRLSVRAVYADHGELAPDAVGFFLEFGDLKIYDTGDTAFRPDTIRESLASNIDLLLAPINGQFGNLTAHETCELAAILKPKTVIASHFWMFLEHVAPDGAGDPVTFLAAARTVCPAVRPLVLAPGERVDFG